MSDDKLSCEHVNTLPRDVNWESEWANLDDDEPRYWEASKCESCGGVLVFQDGCGDETHCHARGNAVLDSSEDDEAAETCDGHVGLCEGPMMAYAYPCLWRDGEEAARLLVDLPVIPVVLADGLHALALTGGGSDLSWEICEAYVRLGFLPPLHYAGDLPRLAGLYLTERRAKILDACEQSAKVALSWADSARKRIRALRKEIGPAKAKAGGRS